MAEERLRIGHHDGFPRSIERSAHNLRGLWSEDTTDIGRVRLMRLLDERVRLVVAMALLVLAAAAAWTELIAAHAASFDSEEVQVHTAMLTGIRSVDEGTG